MPVWLKFRLRRILIRGSEPEAGVWASTIVMRYPAFQRLPNVCFADRNHEIRTRATCGPDQSFAKRVAVICTASSKQSVPMLSGTPPVLSNKCCHDHESQTG